jgi:hypothetical protein
VAAAIALFLHSDGNFRRLVREAANMLGADTDTIGAMAASLAGAWLGDTEIPEEWVSTVADGAYLKTVARFLTSVALRRNPPQTLRLAPSGGSHRTDAGSLLTALKEQAVVPNGRYRHPLFGLESQEVGRPRPKGRVIMATVQFDFGQACKFSSYSALAGSSTTIERSK